jgi:hypothetical protein
MDPTIALSEGLAGLSVRNQPSLTRVSCERDCFVDADHRKYDDHIMRIFSVYRQFKMMPDLPFLLSNITLGDERIVTLSMDAAEKLLSSQPGIEVVLQDGWEKGSFKEVRQLSEFFCCHAASFQVVNYHRRYPLACSARKA